MAGLAITNRALEKYFKYLSNFDNESKKKLIVKLTESINTEESDNFNIYSLFGAWEDSRDSDEIIKDIRESRSEKREIEDF